MEDEFVSTEHLLLALVRVKSPASRILEMNAVDAKSIGEALQSVRGSQKVVDQNPEAKYQALEKYAIDLVEWPKLENSIRSSDATRKFVV